MWENDGVPSVITMLAAAAASTISADGDLDALDQLLRARLQKRHPPLADRAQPLRIVVDAEHRQSVVGEAERERQADSTEADDRYVVAHASRRLSGVDAQDVRARARSSRAVAYWRATPAAKRGL